MYAMLAQVLHESELRVEDGRGPAAVLGVGAQPSPAQQAPAAEAAPPGRLHLLPELPSHQGEER